jgi:hypothetical protein
MDFEVSAVGKSILSVPEVQKLGTNFKMLLQQLLVDYSCCTENEVLFWARIYRSWIVYLR